MSVLKLSPPLLCLITDPDWPDLIQKVEEALDAGINMLQLRGHQLSAAHMYRLARVLLPLCRQHKAAFIVNDRVDVGLAVEADWFQLGASSLPLATVHRLVRGDYLLGASVHSAEEAEVAVADGANFLLVGTIFVSRSHPGRPARGCSLLSEIKRRVPASPLLAIGGITAANARQTIEAGADGVAVISTILGAVDVAQAVQELRLAIQLEKKEQRGL